MSGAAMIDLCFDTDISPIPLLIFPQKNVKNAKFDQNVVELIVKLVKNYLCVCLRVCVSVNQEGASKRCCHQAKGNELTM